MGSRSGSQRPKRANRKQAGSGPGPAHSGRYTVPRSPAAATPAPVAAAGVSDPLRGPPSPPETALGDRTSVSAEPAPEVAAGGGGFDAYVARVAPEAVGATFWLDVPPETGPADRVVLRVAGRRRQGNEEGPGNTHFDHEETVEGLVGGSGPVAVTTRLVDVQPGEWDLSAQAFFEPLPGGRPGGLRTSTPIPVRRAGWSWLRWQAKDCPPGPVTTRLLPWITAPGTLFGFWGIMAVAGIVLALFVQQLLAAAAEVHLRHLSAVSLAALAGGVAGAKLWYVVVHRAARRRDGWCIQGLVAGVTVVGAPVVAAAGLPVGQFLDVTAPALLFGMAVGRIGCFVGGCCYGRPTSSRLGVWSSNRHVGARRVPTQILEGLLSVSLGAAATAAVLSEQVMRGGVFLAALGAYTLVRQQLLRWRAEPRQSSRLTTAASVAAAVALAAGVILAAV